MPILVILLLFVNDHFRFYDLKNKVKSSAYLMASMLQQMNNTRENKQITSKQIGFVAYASCLNLFNTNSAFNPWSLGIHVAVDYVWVKRISNDKYQYQSGWATTAHNGAKNPTEMGQECWGVGTLTLNQVQSKHPDLVCDKDGEERFLILYAYRKSTGFNKSKLGLFLLEPNRIQTSEYRNFSNNNNAIFYYMIVITPKPGLFPAKNEPW